MRKTALATTLVLALLLSATTRATLVNVAEANFVGTLPEIVIKSDGSITPETEFIIRTVQIETGIAG
jgi:hypothetical protein